MEFESWPKTPRLFKNCVITEKIDGTNGAIVIEEVLKGVVYDLPDEILDYVVCRDTSYLIGAQSRNRLLTTEKDNAGFAKWVRANSGDLVEILGPGRHFGEWWGSGIQRGYGLTNGEKRFSLFNTKRWATSHEALSAVAGLDAVPVLGIGTFNSNYILDVFEDLRERGSYAAPGFMDPEGIIVYLPAADQVFKATFESDRGKWTEMKAVA